MLFNLIYISQTKVNQIRVVYDIIIGKMKYTLVT